MDFWRQRGLFWGEPFSLSVGEDPLLSPFYQYRYEQMLIASEALQVEA